MLHAMVLMLYFGEGNRLGGFDGGSRLGGGGLCIFRNTGGQVGGGICCLLQSIPKCVSSDTARGSKEVERRDVRVCWRRRRGMDLRVVFIFVCGSRT